MLFQPGFAGRSVLVHHSDLNAALFLQVKRTYAIRRYISGIYSEVRTTPRLFAVEDVWLSPRLRQRGTRQGHYCQENRQNRQGCSSDSHTSPPSIAHGGYKCCPYSYV